MRTTSRNGLIAIIAAALALTLSPAFGATPSRQVAAADPTSLTAKAVLDRVLSVLGPQADVDARRPNDAATDLSLLLRDLRKVVPDLSAADRKTARTLLARPTDSGGDQLCNGTDQNCRFVLDGTVATKATSHFLIHYQTAPPFLGRNQVTTATQVGRTASVLEEVYTKEISGLKFRKPLSDGGQPNAGSATNPNGLIDVYLVDISRAGYYGYVTSDSEDFTSPLQAPYVVLDNDYKGFQTGPVDSLKVTVAHEFFHGIQYAYDANDSTWFLEGSAVWMEDQIYPSINDYLQYLDNSQIVQSRVPLDVAGDFERYGSVVFWKYLSEGYKSVDLIHQVWNAAGVSAGRKNAIGAVIAVLKAKKINFATAFARYSVWTTLPAGTYADRALFPAFKPWTNASLNTTNDSNRRSVSLDRLSSASARLFTTANRPGRKVVVTVDAPNNIAGQVRITEHRRNGSYVFSTMPLSASGLGSRTLTFNANSSVVVTMVNVTTGADNQPFVFRARVVG